MLQSRLPTTLLVACLLVGGFSTFCESSEERDKLNSYLTPDGTLRQQLVMMDAQEGFVGVIGEIWTIEPSGSWYVGRFINERIHQPHRKGSLTKDQLTSIARVLASNSFFELPATFGRNLKVNRHLVTISFGKKKSTLVLNGGEPIVPKPPLAPGDPHTSMWERFIAIAEAIQNALRDNKADDSNVCRSRP